LTFVNKTVALLVSRCPSVIEQVRTVASTIPQVQVEVSSTHNAISRMQHPGVGLLLAHLEEGQDIGISRLLWSVAQARRPCPTIVLCDRFKEHQAAALLRAGAAHCVDVPNEMARLAVLLRVLTYRLGDRSSQPGSEETSAADLPGTEGLGRLSEQVKRVAGQEITVLLMGETGTGKTRLARQIHHLSPRRGEPFQVVDCGALSASLIESELFGHAKGAFTGADRPRTGKLAAAGSGTLLLDEINSLPLCLQGKLLRAVDERLFEPVGSEKSQPVKARLIAASNVDLEQEVRAGRFRADLFYRLNVVSFSLPPLRSRRQSIGPLNSRFLSEFAARNRPDVSAFSTAALRALENHAWPGNVRELRNVIERAVALSAGPLIEWSDLPESIRAATPAPVPRTLHHSKEEAEIRQIQEALRKHKNKRAGAARELGISRVGLYKKLHRLGLLGCKAQAVAG
jgi:DNA-binding NtrC family response regulator